MIKSITHWFRHLQLYIIADATDNSITLSRALFKRMSVMNLDELNIFVFRVGDSYGFTINPQQLKEADTQFTTIQYNSKYQTIGFETLCPTVNQIFYDYRLPAGTKAKLSIEICHTPDGMTYFKIKRPYVQYIRK